MRFDRFPVDLYALPYETAAEIRLAFQIYRTERNEIEKREQEQAKRRR